MEDVVTTGGTSLSGHRAGRGLRAERWQVIAIIDRLEGGAEAFAARGYPFASLLRIGDFGIEPPGNRELGLGLESQTNRGIKRQSGAFQLRLCRRETPVL